MLEVQDVHYRYNSNIEALKGVSLTVKDGEFCSHHGTKQAQSKTTLVKHFTTDCLSPPAAKSLLME
jgi:ABC-type Na+ transport system ATPase subunit NatA